MDLFSQKIERSELKEGDHVYSWRKERLISHHGIFIGEGKIIHFVNPKKKSTGNPYLAPFRGFATSSDASREFLLAKTVGGTCTTAESDPPEEVIYRATYLHENGYGKYDLSSNNCEDFALYCKTGLWSTDKEYQGRSSQANMVHSTHKTKKDEAMGKKVYRYATAIPRTFLKRESKDLGVFVMML
ncbi:putative LRAT domain-containing protein [Helianthus annuus]|nr:putative LRAT domain-containing protein [Helianthus annuus]KAJ0609315.1 putative LRAT domain-containing protein [Helianthus annuus]KAJ0769373.1 putative LRAT domain-containing protein [Helianthus annuus]KAJ0937234.1 putative LRAT domain-containing protein [Helianthus annuus]